MLMAPLVWLLEVVLWLAEDLTGKILCLTRGHHYRTLFDREVCLSCGHVQRGPHA